MSNGPQPMMTLERAHHLLPGSTLVGPGALPLLRVHTDTRSLRPGDLFLALKGERFDAHEFLPQARAAGAVAAVAERGLDAAGLPGLLVPDSRRALGELAAAWRRQFPIPLIAVTGSNGKTTVTQMIASILRAWMGEAAHATQGNFNNEIGLPLTLLGLREGRHRCAVVELGMNHPGEIARLAAWAAPTVALVNNAQREHQEFMDGVEAVARENGSALQALGHHGVAVFPSDDAYTSIWRELAGGRRVLSFSDQAEAEVIARGEWCTESDASDRPDHWSLRLATPAGEALLGLQLAGRHNLRNAAAAAACALAAGAPLDAVTRGLQAFRPVAGRSQVSRLHFGSDPTARCSATLVDDSYNANPDSVRAAIDLLAALPGPRWLVLGDMGEVGDQGPAFHAEVGEHASRSGLERVWTLGALSRHAADACPGARHFPSMAAVLAALDEPFADGTPPASILVKGSRFMKMEQVVQALRTRARPGPSGQIHDDETGGGVDAA